MLVAAVALVDGPAPACRFGFAAGLLADLGSDHPAGVLALCWLGRRHWSCGLLADRRSAARRDAVIAGVAARRRPRSCRRCCWPSLGRAAPIARRGRAAAAARARRRRCSALSSSPVVRRCCAPTSLRAPRPVYTELRSAPAPTLRRARAARRPMPRRQPPPTPRRLDDHRRARRLADADAARPAVLRAAARPEQAGPDGRPLHDGAIVVPAPRGLDRRRPGPVAGRQHLARRSSRSTATAADAARPGRRRAGAAGRAARHERRRTLAKQITPCSPKVPAPCWTGEPYAAGAGRDQRARRRWCWRSASTARTSPASPSQTVTLPTYPGGVAGRAGARLHRRRHRRRRARRTRTLNDADTIGAAGLEEQYDAVLRGIDGTAERAAQPAGLHRRRRHARSRRRRATRWSPASTRGVQALAEQSLAAADRGLAQGRQAGDRRRGRGDGPATPAASSPRRATRPTTRRCSSAASRDSRLRAADRAERRTTRCSSRAIAGAVRAGLDVQADHLVVAGHAPRDHHRRHLPVPGLADDRRPGQDELRLRGARPDQPARTRSATRATRSSTRPAANEYYADQARIAAAARSRTSTCSGWPPTFGVGTRARASTCRPASRPPAATPTARPGWRGGRRTRRRTAPTATQRLPERSRTPPTAPT